jgi:hypothetical protein
MKKVTLACEAPVKIGELTVTPVVRCAVTWLELEKMPSYYVSKQPVYTILSYRGRVWALDMLGVEVPIHQVKSECAGPGPGQIEISAPAQEQASQNS